MYQTPPKQFPNSLVHLAQLWQKWTLSLALFWPTVNAPNKLSKVFTVYAHMLSSFCIVSYSDFCHLNIPVKSPSTVPEAVCCRLGNCGNCAHPAQEAALICKVLGACTRCWVPCTCIGGAVAVIALSYAFAVINVVVVVIIIALSCVFTTPLGVAVPCCGPVPSLHCCAAAHSLCCHAAVCHLHCLLLCTVLGIGGVWCACFV